MLGTAMFVLWPYAFSFGDEVGYVGEARLLLSGHLSPIGGAPGAFDRQADGTSVTRYPLFISIVFAPLVVIHPRLVFSIGIVALLGAVAVAARVLRRWGSDPTMALLFIVHPTITLMARTAMPDVPLVAASLLAWHNLDQARSKNAAWWFALLVLLKPTGIAIAVALLAGQALEAFVRRDIRPAYKTLLLAGIGTAAGGVVVLSLNWVSWHHLSYSYDVVFKNICAPKFSLHYLPTVGLGYLTSLIIVPPVLLCGALGLWRRSCYGPLFVVGGLVGMMAAYFFADWGPSRLETWVLAQRLILPASGFLLIGYADLLSSLGEYLRVAPILRWVLVGAASAVVIAVGLRHRARQHDMHEALVFAEQVLGREGRGALGTTESAMKASMMHRGPVSMVPSLAPMPRVVLCSVMGESYRAGATASCDLSGYDSIAAYGTYRVLRAR
jgi:hypothetical protein